MLLSLLTCMLLLSLLFIFVCNYICDDDAVCVIKVAVASAVTCCVVV